MIKKILVANRGEIAVRIMRSAREMGIPTVAVYSEADRSSRHVNYADEAYCIGPAPSSESYLRMDAILDAAIKSGSDAIHPGYGFLSENAAFSQLCRDKGIIFIGPAPEVILEMGDKVSARKSMIRAGIPVVPGTEEKITSPEMASEIAARLGFPLMIKASAGGGGKGMRVVNDEKELWEAIVNARSEALASFGDESVYIEKYIASPHHIEFQVLGDHHGNIVHLYERECSIQRRHQKIIEETPSPLLTPEVRKKMSEAAVTAARSVNYTGAGTIEFLVDEDLNFYFLEMNTRLQVEHPITEETVGLDLVKQQIRISNGEELGYSQDEIQPRGHSIECRICAEDPMNNFMPNPGVIRHITEPLGLGVRVDSYVYDGYEIPIHYDPMIAKLVVWAVKREYAIERMRRALHEYKIIGVANNLAVLRRIMDSNDFVQGKYNTHFIEKNLDELLQPEKNNQKETEDVAMMAAYFDYLINMEESTPVTVHENRASSRWKELGKHKNLYGF
ncbi:MAG: acetyl-CoA carboxylase biotin carboxylase subunit [Bacteroidota bacterium]